jgi:RNA polymerase sigma factor (sigma-70 family)
MAEVQLQVDEVLIPLLRVSDELESQRLMMQLITEHASPVIKDIIKYKLRRARDRTENYARDNQDAEDIHSDVVVQLLARLAEFKANPSQKSINHLRSYVAVIAYHSCYRYLRQVYPQRHILKNRLRYLLTHQAGFSIWEGEHKELICGFTAWRASKARASAERVTLLGNDPRILEQETLLASGAQSAKPADTIAAVFTYLEGPVDLDELVKIVAQLWGVKDQDPVSETDADGDRHVRSEQVDPGTEVDKRDYLQKLWQEVCALPVRQRAALLLNLKGAEGRGCIELFQFAGVATIEQIAGSLDMPLEQFAALWNELPLDDLRIAERLGLTRQQVINLRKSARARLARRMKYFE